MLDLLRSGQEDSPFDIGCGGGAFLGAAARESCTATGLDHSPEQLRVAESQNAGAMIISCRLQTVRSHALPCTLSSTSLAILSLRSRR